MAIQVACEGQTAASQYGENSKGDALIQRQGGASRVGRREGHGLTTAPAAAGIEAREVMRLFMPREGQWISLSGPWGANGVLDQRSWRQHAGPSAGGDGHEGGPH